MKILEAKREESMNSFSTKKMETSEMRVHNTFYNLNSVADIEKVSSIIKHDSEAHSPEHDSGFMDLQQ